MPPHTTTLLEICTCKLINVRKCAYQYQFIYVVHTKKCDNLNVNFWKKKNTYKSGFIETKIQMQKGVTIISKNSKISLQKMQNRQGV